MITIVDNGGANITSIQFALARLGADTKLTIDAEEIKSASHVILPGVGAAVPAMEKLKKLNLIETLQSLTQPVLGICLGMQLMYEASEEGNVPCLQMVPGIVKKLNPEPSLTIPHMGWNSIKFNSDAALFKRVSADNYVYFIHSYAAPVNSVTAAVTDYNQNFAAAMQYKNFYGTQFHPERSGKIGELILKNFLEL